MNRLEDKIAIITGGTRGIGRAIAAKYLEHGASVIIVGTNDERGCEACEFLKGHKVKEAQKMIDERQSMLGLDVKELELRMQDRGSTA